MTDLNLRTKIDEILTHYGSRCTMGVGGLDRDQALEAIIELFPVPQTLEDARRGITNPVPDLEKRGLPADMCVCGHIREEHVANVCEDDACDCQDFRDAV